tara:strand:+ start:4192 stop:4425 length:234 start_codon:yes stop_codon:yes gene_type:complete
MNNTSKKTLSTVEQLTSLLQAEEVILTSKSKALTWTIKSGDVELTFTGPTRDFVHNYHTIKQALEGFAYDLTMDTTY